jgi:hypothetical protein
MARTTSSDPTQVATIGYTRDATNRLVHRDATAGDPQATVLYGYTGGGDSASLTLGADKRILSRTLSLPGGVLLTFTYPGGVATPEYDHVTVRGDICLSTDATGKQAGVIYTYDAFGQPLRPDGTTIDPQAVPANQPGKMNYGWLGQHQRPYEHAGGLSLVEMGARPLQPPTRPVPLRRPRRRRQRQRLHLPHRPHQLNRPRRQMVFGRFLQGRRAQRRAQLEGLRGRRCRCRLCLCLRGRTSSVLRYLTSPAALTTTCSVRSNGNSATKGPCGSLGRREGEGVAVAVEVAAFR